MGAPISSFKDIAKSIGVPLQLKKRQKNQTDESI
jgi:hypothetical protein